jgi:hypothetical protein
MGSMAYAGRPPPEPPAGGQAKKEQPAEEQGWVQYRKQEAAGSSGQAGKPDPWGNQWRGETGGSPAQEVPTRHGRLAPGGQDRPIQLIKPGQFEGRYPAAEGAEEGTEQQPQDPKAAGSGSGAQQGNPWESYKPYPKGNTGHDGSGPRKAAHQGIPEGARNLPETNIQRNPTSDFMYHVSWKADTEEANRLGRDYLTASSEHAKEVHETQLPARKVFLATYSWHNGHDGLTFRQYLDGLATLQGALSHGQVASISGGHARWGQDAQRGKLTPPGFDDSWCLCGQWVRASATFCNCGFPAGRYRKGDWKCTHCGKTNFGKNNWCCKCKNAPVSEGMHAVGDDSLNRAKQQLMLQPMGVETSRPSQAGSDLFVGVSREETQRLVDHPGWGAVFHQDAQSINRKAEYHRYMEEQDTLWKRTGGEIWDGLQAPCFCNSYTFAHYHAYSGRYTEGAKAAKEVAVPFWTKVISCMEERHQEEIKLQEAVEAEGQAHHQQLEETKNGKEAVLEALRKEVQEAVEIIEKLQQEGQGFTKEDPPTMEDRQRRRIQAAETFLEATRTSHAMANAELETAVEAIVEEETAREAARQAWRSRCEAKEETVHRAGQQKEELAGAQGPQASANGQGKEEPGGHAKVPSGAEAQAAKQDQDKRSADSWARKPTTWPWPENQGAKEAEEWTRQDPPLSPDVDQVRRAEWSEKTFGKRTKEEAERYLAQTHTKEAEARNDEIRKGIALLENLSKAVCDNQASAEDKRVATAEWEWTRNIQHGLEQDKRKMDIFHQRQAQAMEDFYANKPVNDDEAGRTSRLGSLRQEEEEWASKKERLAARTLKLRHESDEADRTDSAARSKAVAAATLLSQAMQEEQRLDNGLATIKEAIDKQHSAWAAQNQAEQKESTHRSWEPPAGAQGQAAGSADGAARPVLAVRFAFPPGDPRAVE